MTVEDCEKVENIKQFLITEEAGTQRKSLVLMYLQRVSYTCTICQSNSITVETANYVEQFSQDRSTAHLY